MTKEHPNLPRVLGLGNAVMLGLGSILGTGVFVSLAIATDVAGVWMLPALLLACGLAVCNGLSSAALVGAHPVSGGTYEYGYRYLHPLAGFTAGWTFLIAKTASAAAAALGCAGYLLALLGQDGGSSTWLALEIVVLMTILVLSGIRRSTLVNGVIVSVTLLALVSFVAGGIGTEGFNEGLLAQLGRGDGFEWTQLLQATALLFVAFTGYARIATLGEEVREPQRTIPRAIILSLAIAGLLYLGVASTGISVLGAAAFGQSVSDGVTPLEQAAKAMGPPALPKLVAIGAVTAMLGVLLNLILGLSRTLLAMARRGDMPQALAAVSGSGTPAPAIVAVTVVILGLSAMGDIKLAWSFSAFNVLVYYAITNAAAISLLRGRRRARLVLPLVGLAACLGLAFLVEARIWLVGLGLIVIGLIWFWLRTPARAAAKLPA